MKYNGMKSNKVKSTGLIQIGVILMLTIVGNFQIKAQQNRRVLFIGNSYTGTNNLPQIINNLALSNNDTVTYDSNTPGGFSLLDHSTSVTTSAKIMTGNWDYIIIQGQSQEPIVNFSAFRNGANVLYNQIRQYNPCSTIMPYMIWGRKNGDATTCSSFPLMCTYELMDTTIRDRYLDLTATVNGEVAPVSIVWRYLRHNHPTINLYQVDESHPSAEGSFAAACTFYASIFKKDPTLATFNFGLNASVAATIKAAAKAIVFDSLKKWDYKQKASADFNYSIGSGMNQVSFVPIVRNRVRQSYLWHFGDGDSSTAINPIHSYAIDSAYNVRLTTTNCDLQGSYISIKDTVIQFCSHTPSITIKTQPLCNQDTLWTQQADAYRWLYNGQLLPETNRYLDNYQRYGILGFSVLSTSNSCTELSEKFNQSPQWSGYYFNYLGDPCKGDTVALAIQNAFFQLNGNETILWYKNDTLLTNFSNQDTLLITSAGNYVCKVVNSNSTCPLDTTYGRVSYSCSIVGFPERLYHRDGLQVFPNPSSGIVNIKSEEFDLVGIEIFNMKGDLIHSKELNSYNSYEVNIQGNKRGVYLVKVLTVDNIKNFKLILTNSR